MYQRIVLQLKKLLVFFLDGTSYTSRKNSNLMFPIDSPDFTHFSRRPEKRETRSSIFFERPMFSSSQLNTVPCGLFSVVVQLALKKEWRYWFSFNLKWSSSFLMQIYFLSVLLKLSDEHGSLPSLFLLLVKIIISLTDSRFETNCNHQDISYSCLSLQIDAQ